ncbi:MAG: InlB B-repeat-containing protein [Clostridiales bacterium]|nr:InlB B-repeat-containing protein [Clostridiales bacterium]
MRNGETLDVSWAIFDENGVGITQDGHNEDLTITLCDSGDDNNGTHGDVVITINNESLQNLRFNSMSGATDVVYEHVNNYDITRTSRRGYITVQVKNGNASAVPMQFPITVTLVDGDGRTGCPLKADGESDVYYEYRLSLDCIMDRSYEAENNGLNIRRLFTDPTNIEATITGTATYTDQDNVQQTRTIPVTYAARAIDDPVYYTGLASYSNTSYCYDVRPGMAAYDEADYDHTLTGEPVTGKCVVNSHFGDAIYSISTDGSSGSTIQATQWTSTGGDAVLTSFRHLYNIRWIPSGKTANYRIISDLNWYLQQTGLAAVSDVRVYTTSSSHTPVTSGTVNVVSFPALGVLNNNQTLLAMPKKSGTGYYSINNVQMRLASFRPGTDAGYGLICKNNGAIVDVHTNNLNLVMASVNDGGNDFASIFVNQVSITTQEGGSGSFTQDRPVGGLVGINTSTGVVGQTDGSIVMSNTIVMGNNYWKVYANVNKIGTGGVIGKNESGMLGSIEINGRFAVVGRDNVGGIIGYSTANVGARLLVNYTEAPSTQGVLPVYNNAALGSNNMSCAVLAKNNVGAAIGQLQNASLTYDAGNPFTYSATPESGVFSAVNTNNFQIDVTLNSNSLIYMFGTFNADDSKENEKPAAGGVIGFMNSVPASTSSIRVNNAGSVIVNDTSSRIYCGGVIGRDYNSSNNIYIDFNNRSGRIGYFGDTTGPLATGGAIGHIYSTKTGRTIAINGINAGTIVSRGSDNGQGTGGAIGGVRSGNANIDFRIDVVNEAGSRIISTGSNEDNGNGAGGAIGGMGNSALNDNMQLPAASVVRSVNRGTITGHYHVGGTIGNSPAVYGRVYAVNSGLIEGNNFVGGAIGRDAYLNAGTIQSTLETNAQIHGDRFVGGAVGRLLNAKNGSYVRTIVKGNAEVVSNNASLVGGVGGDISVADTGTNINIELVGDGSAPTLTVRGNEGIGGVAGILRANVENSARVTAPDQSATNKLVINVNGVNYVGGVLGVLRSSSNNGNAPADVIGLNPSNKAIKIDLSVVLNGSSTITGTGEDVGGAIGYINSNNSDFSGHISVATSGYSESASSITGNNNVGGAIGRVQNTRFVSATTESVLSVDFGVDTWTIKGNIAAGNDSNVGGAVGYFEASTARADTGTYQITVNLGSTNVTGSGRNVGGVIGKNMTFNGKIELTNMSGKVSGQRNIGGAIGYNVSAVNSISTTVSGTGLVESTGETMTYNAEGPNVTDTVSNTGGAVGYNMSSVTTITAVINGHVNGGGSNVGGAIGFSDSDRSGFWLTSVSATIEGTAEVRGNNNVGGAIGLNRCNVDSVTSEIAGQSGVAGSIRIGGAIGFASAQSNKTGTDMLDEKSYGKINFVSATISADNALEGSSRIGGAIGQIGNKWSAASADYVSAAVVRVEAIINSSTLFDTSNTGPLNPAEDACVGGVVGHFVDGRLGIGQNGKQYAADRTPGVYLRGTGGVVHTDYPNRTYSNTVLMAARGSTIGGIIGQIGVPNLQQNVYVTNISADGGPFLCVQSTNGGNCVGGWIGAGYAGHGGIGNETSSNNPVAYTVNNVRTVYSTGSEVGGFMGRLNSQNGGSNSKKGVFARIIVNLNGANITGANQVGGVFGSFTSGWYTAGSIEVTLSNRTNIGDISGNALPGDETEYTPICYDCGGAIGFVNSPSGSNGDARIQIPVNVYADSTSRIWAGGTVPVGGLALADAGVGGAFGRFTAEMNGNTRVQVVAANNTNTPVTVYSRSSNVGGIAGVWIGRGMTTDNNYSKSITYLYSDAAVTGDGSSVGVGGCAGRMTAGYIRRSRVNGYVTATGANASAGGFIGYAENGTVIYCGTTTIVTSTSDGDACTGGFIGYLPKGSVSYCYVGGHTFQGQFIAGEGNITGRNNVGGFVGMISGASNNTTINQCYSTASVLGTGENIGGFVGNADKGKITNSYSAGRVTGSTNTGAFAGVASADMTMSNGDKNYALSGVNIGSINLVGREGDRQTGIGWQTASQIRNGASHTAHSFDSTLPTTFELRAVVNDEHYGDWSLGNPEDLISIENAEVTIDSGVPGHPDEFPYRREGVTLTEENIEVVVEGQTLVLGTDYVLGYRNNTNIGTATVQIAGIGRYTGAISKTFTIVAADIKLAEVVLNSATEEYTGAPIVPDITVTLAGETLVYNEDYYFEYDPDNTNLGDVVVTVIGIGNYTGTADATATFRIVGMDISTAEVTLVDASSLVYTGEELEPQAIVRLGGRRLIEGTDYDIEYVNNIHAGDNTASVVITGKGSYDGVRTETFSIARATNAWTTEPDISGWIWGEEMSTPVGAARFGTVEFAYYSDAALENEIDITQADAGTYYLRAYVPLPTEYHDYDAPVDKVITFTIEKVDLIDGTVVVYPDEYPRTGDPITPESITVTVGSRTLIEGTDYTVSYPSDITSAGNKPITITGIGNYYGSLSSSYDIYNVFTVTFITGSGSAVPSQDIIEGQSATEPAEPTYGGYHFRGWYTDTSYDDDKRYDDFSTPVTADISLYARWVQYHIVTFVTGDGASAVDPQEVDVYASADRPPDPTRPGYQFRDWYRNQDCTGEPYNFTVVYDDMSIYAGWDPIVTFDSMGGTAVDPAVAQNGRVTEPSYPSKDGFTFTGWFTDDACTTPFDFSSTVTEPVTLYAGWQEN